MLQRPLIEEPMASLSTEDQVKRRSLALEALSNLDEVKRFIRDRAEIDVENELGNNVAPNRSLLKKQN